MFRAVPMSRLLLAAAASAMLAACATYAPRPLDPGHSAAVFAARRLDDEDLRNAVARLTQHPVSSWPPAEWDRAELLAVALARNPGLDVARAEIASAQAREITAAEIPNPTLGLETEYARREADHWLYGLSLDFALRPPGTRRRAIEGAREETAVAREKLMDHIWDVRRAMIAALSDGESARRRRGVLTRLAAAQDDLVALQERRVAAGEDSPADLVVAHAARIEIDQQQAAAREDAVRAKNALAAALGIPVSALDGATFDWPDWGKPPAIDADRYDSAREQALLARADLAAAIGEYAQTETRLKQAIARQYPSIELHPGYYWDHGIAKWPFDVGLALPLFHRNQGEIAEATAARDVAGKRMLALQADIQGEIDAARAGERVARDHLDAAERRHAAVQQQLDQADLALRLGALDRMQRIGTEIVALRSELETIDASARLQAARDALEDALHVPLSGPELSLAPAESGRKP